MNEFKRSINIKYFNYFVTFNLSHYFMISSNIHFVTSFSLLVLLSELVLWLEVLVSLGCKTLAATGITGELLDLSIGILVGLVLVLSIGMWVGLATPSFFSGDGSYF